MTSAPPSGRLTLSWVGKDCALLGTAAGGYEWVERDDPRVTEVRLLRERDVVGDAALGSDGAGNLLVVGDAYDALHALTRIPEYADDLLGKVKLIYIDPPFNTGQAFTQYDDALEHSVWLTMMRDRLLFIRDLLAPDGSVWVHLDDAEMAYCRVLMDEVFGRGNFIGNVVWQKIHARNNSGAALLRCAGLPAGLRAGPDAAEAWPGRAHRTQRLGLLEPRRRLAGTLATLGPDGFARLRGRALRGHRSARRCVHAARKPLVVGVAGDLRAAPRGQPAVVGQDGEDLPLP